MVMLFSWSPAFFVRCWHIAAPDVCDCPQLAKADTAFQAHPLGQPTEPCLAADCQAGYTISIS